MSNRYFHRRRPEPKAKPAMEDSGDLLAKNIDEEKKEHKSWEPVGPRKLADDWQDDDTGGSE